jgi:hypothetical protein
LHNNLCRRFPHGEQVREEGVGEGREGDARAEARHAAQRRLGQEGGEPQAGHRDRIVRGAARRGEGPAGEEDAGVGEVRGLEEIVEVVEIVKIREILEVSEIDEEHGEPLAEVGREEVVVEEIACARVAV